MVPDPDGYDEPVAPEDGSDDSDSDFDFEDQDDSDNSFPGIRKTPHKRTSRVDTRRVDNTDAVDEMLLAAATEDSIRDFMSGGASTSAVPSGHEFSGLNGFPASMAINCYNPEVVSDSEPEGDLLGPLVQMWMAPANGIEYTGQNYTDDVPQDAYSARRETRRLARLEKQDIRMLEYKLGRRLTHVGLVDLFCPLIYSFHFSYLILTQAEKSTIQLQRHHPELRDAWGDLEAAARIVEPQKAEQPSGLKVTLLPFQQESLYWMRNQEFGQYAGGLLAVSFALLLEIMPELTLNPGRTRWGTLILWVLWI